ncbi:hypothetical protein BMW23_0042 [Bodo saltans virus]|uniref:Uncharacterized protein n=1 Tax=Bodo saltans virus TaxID=2024608 RepID=A0A2H4UTA3_9VIRU|nr:hypothetical protein QJ851_gp0041 [Bodo saltans virus]ATZ80104.1 hypothetical protein BMW23_0042 [Bodo saltans virus]
MIVDEKIKILFDNQKMAKIFEMIEFDENKVKSIYDKFIDFMIKKRKIYSYKNENDEPYDFYKIMMLKTCF